MKKRYIVKIGDKKLVVDQEKFEEILISVDGFCDVDNLLINVNRIDYIEEDLLVDLIIRQRKGEDVIDELAEYDPLEVEEAVRYVDML